MSLHKYFAVIWNENNGIATYLKQKTAGLKTGILWKFLNNVLFAIKTTSGLPNNAKLVLAL